MFINQKRQRVIQHQQRSRGNDVFLNSILWVTAHPRHCKTRPGQMGQARNYTLKRFIFVQLREFITYGSHHTVWKKKKKRLFRLSRAIPLNILILKQTTAVIDHVPIRWSIHLLSICKSPNACYWFYLTFCAKQQYGDIKTTVVSFTSCP